MGFPPLCIPQPECDSASQFRIRAVAHGRGLPKRPAGWEYPDYTDRLPLGGSLAGTSIGYCPSGVRPVRVPRSVVGLDLGLRSAAAAAFQCAQLS